MSDSNVCALPLPLAPPLPSSKPQLLVGRFLLPHRGDDICVQDGRGAAGEVRVMASRRRGCALGCLIVGAEEWRRQAAV